jgi:hypothetical protein
VREAAIRHIATTYNSKEETMNKTKTFLGLVVMIGALAATTTSSFAWFRTTSSTLLLNAIPLSTYVLEGGGGTLSCSPETGLVAHVKIAKKVGTKIYQQVESMEGPDLVLHQLNWGKNCTAESGGLKFAAEIKPCLLHLQQQNKGQTTGLRSSLLTECVIKVPGLGCEIKVPPANETTGENYNLLESTVEKAGGSNTKTIIKGKGSPVTFNGSGLCPKSTTGSFKAENEVEELELA